MTQSLDKIISKHFFDVSITINIPYLDVLVPSAGKYFCFV